MIPKNERGPLIVLALLSFGALVSVMYFIYRLVTGS